MSRPASRATSATTAAGCGPCAAGPSAQRCCWASGRRGWGRGRCRRSTAGAEAEADFLGYQIAKVAGFHVEGNRHRLDYDTWLWEKHGASRSWWQRLTASHPPSRRRAQALAVLCGFARATCAMHCGGPLPPDDHGGRNVEGGAAALESRNDPLWAVRVVNYTGSACSRLKLGKVLGRGEYECSLMTA